MQPKRPPLILALASASTNLTGELEGLRPSNQPAKIAGIWAGGPNQCVDGIQGIRMPTGFAIGMLIKVAKLKAIATIRGFTPNSI